MGDIDSYVDDIMRLFEMDLLNKFERVGNAVIVTMQDGSRVSVLVKKLA